MEAKVNVSRWIVMGLVVSLSAACGVKDLSPKDPTRAATQGGGVDGGGGYADRNATAVLSQVSKKLASELRNASDGAMSVLPGSWQAKRVAEVIEKIELKPLERKDRDGHPLMFDYDAFRGTIAALSPFFTSYASFPEGKPVPVQVERELKIKLLHEASHLWGLDEDSAETFAQTLYGRIEHDLMVCVIPEPLTPGNGGSLGPAVFIAHFPAHAAFFDNDWPTDVDHLFASGVTSSFYCILAGVSGTEDCRWGNAPLATLKAQGNVFSWSSENKLAHFVQAEVDRSSGRGRIKAMVYEHPGDYTSPYGPKEFDMNCRFYDWNTKRD